MKREDFEAFSEGFSVLCAMYPGTFLTELQATAYFVALERYDLSHVLRAMRTVPKTERWRVQMPPAPVLAEQARIYQASAVPYEPARRELPPATTVQDRNLDAERRCDEVMAAARACGGDEKEVGRAAMQNLKAMLGIR